MSRTITAVRHGKPRARANRDDYRGPHLRTSAVLAADRLKGVHPHFINGIERMAVSDTWRARDTAELLGAKTLEITSVLDEINTNIHNNFLRAMAEEGRAPKEFVQAGHEVLRNPPESDDWIIHAYKGMGILAAVVEVGGRLNSPSLLAPNLAIVEFTF